MEAYLVKWSTSQARATRRGGSKDSSMVQIRTPSEVIETSESEKLLGCVLHQDMKFGENLLHNEESVLRSLNTRIGALLINQRNWAVMTLELAFLT